MKIRNIINSTIALFMVLTFASCDALDLKPISFITNESFWQTEDDVKGALNGIYVQLRGAAEHDLYILGEARSEILTVGIGGYGGYDIYYYSGPILPASLVNRPWQLLHEYLWEWTLLSGSPDPGSNRAYSENQPFAHQGYR